MNFVQKLLFSGVTPLIRRGKLRPLDAPDFPELEPHQCAFDTEKSFVGVSDPRPYHFVWKMFWSSGPGARKLFALLVVRLPLSLLGPYLLHALLSQMSTLGEGPTYAALGTGVALALTVIFDGVVVQHYFFYALQTYQRITSGLNMRVYRASLKLSREAQVVANTGDLVNHLSSDTEGIAESSFFIPEITFGILLFLGSCVILTRLLGKAAWVAIVFAVAFAPFTRIFARRFQKTDKALWKYRDQRVTLMSQILTGIRLVKSYAWEKSMIAEIDALRRSELNSSLELVRNEARSTLFSLGMSLAMSTIAFMSFVLLGGHLSAEIIFPCILVFQQIDMPLSNFPHWLKDIIHSRVAADRLDKYFKLPQKIVLARDSIPLERTVVGAEISGVSLTLNEKMILNDVSLKILPGESIAIVGEVGSGKTSLLLSLLGEVSPQTGSLWFTNLKGEPCSAPQQLGWAPQEPYILNASVKENILIASAETKDFELGPILRACALVEDLSALPAGIETEIGERGVNLSGGQKQRVALARIAASSAEFLLLDDPLSAVDPKTEKILVDELLFGIWQAKTRIVTTHRLDCLNRFDRVVMMDQGAIVASGTLTELLQSSQSFRDFYGQHLESAAHAPLTEMSTHPHSIADAVTSTAGGLMTSEDRSVGAVPTRLYWDYFKSLGGSDQKRAPWILGGLVTLSLLVVAIPILQNRWIGLWADGQNTSGFLHAFSGFSAVTVYGALGILTLVSVFFERMGWMIRAVESGAEIHSSALQAVLEAPIRFFDTTPVGRLINRFARDLQSVDDALSWNFRGTVGALAAMLGTLVIILIVVPGLVFAIAPVLFIFYRIQRDYRSSAREAKRLESISRSPRFAHFKETLSGLSVVRALGIEERFLNKMVTHLEYYTRMYWGSILINRWFSTRVPVVSGVIALTTSIATIYLVSHAKMQPGLAGMLLTYSMTFWAQLNWSVRSFSEVESRMTSYERLRTFSAIEPELGSLIEPTTTLTAWPTNGAIHFKDVFSRYSPELPDALAGVNFEIPARAQVGVIGRTGSGKSSLIQALFRFMEIRSGSILIDGVDIREIQVSRLRQAFSIIPQDPILFIGTIRTNLDRFGKFSDEEIWRSLERVRMEKSIRNLGGLDSAVQENGYNFSQGQRQLLCLSRALLNQSRIIVLDEATASIDVSTDSMIQTAIREEFSHATVLIIAHRPNSVAHCEWILEMNRGKSHLRHRNRKTIKKETEPLGAF